VSRSPLSRRQFLSTLGLALAGVACTGTARPKRTSLPPAPGSLDALKRGAKGLSLAVSADRDNPLNPGKSHITFALITTDGNVVTGGSPQLYAAQRGSDRAVGPFSSVWSPFTGYEQTGDHSPKSPVPGTYAADIDVPSAGTWTLLALIDNAGKKEAGQAVFVVTTSPIIAAVGSKAISVPTPVATTEAKLEEICTRTPPDHMHAISLDEALKNGKPTVVSFATPLLCESMLCGPVVDEQILVFEKYGPDRANFIHVEEFLPGPSHSPGPADLQHQSPGFKAWKFQSEPWVLVIDRHGIIRGRFGPGPATAPEIEAALQPVL